MILTRRKLLASGATVAAAAIVPGMASAGADRAQEFDVEIDYPESWLQTYRPQFVGDRQTMQRSAGLFAHRARHDDREHDVACYWHRLTHQDGLPLLDSDAHLFDHEPAYVFVDDSGNVDQVDYTAYHHFAESLKGERLQQVLTTDETGDPTHPQLEIVNPWHHYLPRSDPPDERTTFVDVEGDADASHLETWETRGIFESTAVEAIYDPWTVADRGSWWDEETLDYRVASLWLRLGRRLDIGGSGDSEVYD